MGIQVEPSLMSMSLLNVQHDLEILDRYADCYHVDIIDWHYCKNMCLTPQFIRQIADVTRIPIEAHLYMDNIDAEFIDLCCSSGASLVTMPADIVSRQVHRFKQQLDASGTQLGIFLNPADPISLAGEYLDIVDRVLLMTVDPGFSGQDFITRSLAKIEKLAQLRDREHLSFEIAVDGCCNRDNFAQLAKAGADVFIMGRGLFERSPDLETAARLTREEIKALSRSSADGRQ